MLWLAEATQVERTAVDHVRRRDRARWVNHGYRVLVNGDHSGQRHRGVLHPNHAPAESSELREGAGPARVVTGIDGPDHSSDRGDVR